MISVFDPKGAEILRMNRNILSTSIIELINEYGPKAFPDFDGN
jgi:glycerol-3-phosphate O-acyltransferase/dihydroxyacetone phosphate acyltransferase